MTRPRFAHARPGKSLDPQTSPTASSRRDFFRAGAVMTAVPVLSGLGGTSIAHADQRPPYDGGGSATLSPGAVIGPIGQIDAASASVTIGRAPNRTVDVVFAEDSVLWRDKQVVVSAFTRGDFVLVEGRLRGEVFEGASMQPLYQGVELATQDASGASLETSLGPLQFSDRTLDVHTGTRASIDTFTHRRSVRALTRRDPRTGNLIAMSVAASA